jgi:hypothetical protein
MTLAMACCVVWRGQTRMPPRGERQGPRRAVVAVGGVAAERLGPGLHAAGRETLGPRGDGPGVGWGRAYPHPAVARAGARIALARPGTLRCVGGLGPRGGGTAAAPVDRAGTTSPGGPLARRGPRCQPAAPHRANGRGALHVSPGEGAPSPAGRPRPRPHLGGPGGPAPAPPRERSPPGGAAGGSPPPGARGRTRPLPRRLPRGRESGLGPRRRTPGADPVWSRRRDSAASRV